MKPETKIKLKKILRACAWSFFIAGLFVLLGFANGREDRMTCKKLDIRITEGKHGNFVEADDIRQMLTDKGIYVEGSMMASIDINGMEKMFYDNPWIEKANSYSDINGMVTIEIEQREPLIRIVNAVNESYYIATDGKLMVWSPRFTPQVLVASGNIPESYGNWYQASISQIEANDSLAKTTVLDDLDKLARFITADEFWNAQVESIFINAKNEIELVPRVGNHRIVFGTVENMEKKFANLKLFYRQGLNKEGWNKYDTLNLKFDGQVVCAKKQVIVAAEDSMAKARQAAILKEEMALENEMKPQPEEKKEKNEKVKADSLAGNIADSADVKPVKKEKPVKKKKKKDSSPEVKADSVKKDSAVKNEKPKKKKTISKSK